MTQFLFKAFAKGIDLHYNIVLCDFEMYLNYFPANPKVRPQNMLLSSLYGNVVRVGLSHDHSDQPITGNYNDTLSCITGKTAPAWRAGNSWNV